MIFSKATGRYAKTFFSVSLQQNKVEEVAKDMSLLGSLITGLPELKAFLKNPLAKDKDIENILLSKISGKISPLSERFLKLLIQKKRTAIIAEISQAFSEEYEKHHNIQRALVKSVLKLDSDQLGKIKSKLIQITGASDIIIKNVVDPKLVAGLQIQIGDSIIEANVRSKLIQLKRKLAA